MPAKAWIIAAALLCLSPAHAAWVTDAPAAQGHWRIPLDDAIYATLGDASFEQLRLHDTHGQEQAYALCAQRQAGQAQELLLPSTALVRGSEPSLDASGQLQVLRSPGLKEGPPWLRLIVDLRELPGPLQALQWPSHSEQEQISLRSSPDLRQWSRPLSLRREGDRLVLDRPLSQNWLGLSFDPPLTRSPDALRVWTQAGKSQRAVHWFQAELNPEGVYRHNRSQALRGVRLDASDIESLQLESRLGPGDAWKSRGSWRPAQGAAELLFPAVGDQEWRVRTQPEQVSRASFAHDALELRLPSDIQPPLRLSIGPRQRPLLTCPQLGSADRMTALQLRPADGRDGALSGQSEGPQNLRPWFLLIALPLVLLWFWHLRRRSASTPSG